MSSVKKVWFLTGSSSGLGRSMLVHLLEQGDNVVATMRSPSAVADIVAQYPLTQLLVLKLDVASPSEIKDAFHKAIDFFGRIDIVYNNAGYGILGEVEATTEEVARTMFDVNFWGAMNVAREAVRIFRDVNKPAGGHLLQVSSYTAAKGLVGLGYYSASKHALEGVSQALAGEMHPSWNIKVTLLELGGFKTRAVSTQSMVVLPVHAAYTTENSKTAHIRRYLLSDEGMATMGDSDKAAREMRKIALDPAVNFRVPIGHDALETVKSEAQKKLQEVEDAQKWSVDLSQ